MPKNLTKKQKAYADSRAIGRTREQSAILAGYAENTVDPNTTRIEANPQVQAEVARIRAEVAVNVGISKEDVVEMFVKAYSLATQMADPGGMIMAAREIGRVLGHYAPEVKKIVNETDKGAVIRAIENMPTDELMKLANARVIDGESKRITEQNVSEVRADESPEPVLQAP